jgi:hypothetical protein
MKRIQERPRRWMPRRRSPGTMTPNQWGTWWFGRGAGVRTVVPFVVVAGRRARRHGDGLDPGIYDGDTPDDGGDIVMSWLVIYSDALLAVA